MCMMIIIPIEYIMVPIVLYTYSQLGYVVLAQSILTVE